MLTSPPHYLGHQKVRQNSPNRPKLRVLYAKKDITTAGGGGGGLYDECLDIEGKGWAASPICPSLSLSKTQLHVIQRQIYKLHFHTALMKLTRSPSIPLLKFILNLHYIVTNLVGPCARGVVLQ